MFISLIIPTYNREDYLVQTINCALNQNYVEHEVIVVDQTAKHNKETQSYLQNLIDQKRIKYIYCETPSVTNARNLGVKNAKGDIIVFVDDDTEFNNNFLKNHLEAHKNNIDVVQGRVLESDSTIKTKPTWVNFLIKFKGSDTAKKTGATNSVTGCNFSFKKIVHSKIGGFDTNYYGCSTREDTDFGYRAYKAGYNIQFIPNAELFHHKSSHGGVDTGINNQMFDLSYYFCEMYFAKKNFSLAATTLYKIRLMLRGYKQINKLIKKADQKTNEVIENL